MADPFSEALAHHKAGRLEQAVALYRQVLATNPNHADSWNLLGVVAHQKGDDALAAELGEKAIQIDASRPAYFVNLATAYRGIGRHEEAVSCCRAVLAAQPELVEARLSLGISLTALKHWVEAEEQLRWVINNRPNDSRGPQALASCLREQGSTEEAIALYHQALALNPNDAAAHLGLGTTLMRDRNAGAAEPHLQRAAELQPRVATAWSNLGSSRIVLGREQEAMDAFEKALQLAPSDPGVGVNVGQAWLGIGNHRAAEQCFNAVLNYRSEFAPALQGLADVRREEDRLEEAVALYERAVAIDPEGDAYKGLAQALWELGDVDRSAAMLRAGIAKHPRDAENHVRLAVGLASGGDIEGAAAECREALRLKPGHPPALVELALARRGKLPDEDLKQLESALQMPVSAAARAAVHFGIAHVADGRSEFAKAAEHLRLGNGLMKAANESRNRGYDPARFTQYIDRMIATFTPAFFETVKGFGLNDERPVFVVGMPRSGTTLIEQILASHPKVYGAGERRFASRALQRLGDEPLETLKNATPEMIRGCAEWHLEQLTKLDGGRAARVVDKMPDNYALLGWLATEFPKARFIHSRRDVRDIALSCWMTNFSGLHWSNDLEHIAHRVRGYQRIMDHWRAVLPVKVLDIDYEKLVADQEGESRRMIAWLGLEWDPAVLQFHRAERLVKTASVTQVRQPMYSRSVERWKHYEEALKPFLRVLES